MGIFVSKFNNFSFYLLHGKEPLKVMVLGLDAAGRCICVNKIVTVETTTVCPFKR